MHLVLYVACAGKALVAQHFGQYGLEGGDPVDAAVALGGEFEKAVVGYVEGGAVAVARVFGGVAVEAAQAGYVLVGAEYGGDDEFVGGVAFGDEGVVEGAGYGVEQRGGAGHKVGDGLAQGIDVVVGIVGYVDKAVHAPAGLGAVGYVGDACAGGGGKLYVVEVGKGGFKAGHAHDAVFYGGAVGAQQGEGAARAQQQAVDGAGLQLDAVGAVVRGGAVGGGRGGAADEARKGEVGAHAFGDGEGEDDGAEGGEVVAAVFGEFVFHGVWC